MRLLVVLVLVSGCSNFAQQTKVWEQGCDVTVDGTISAGMLGVTGQATIHKECKANAVAQ